MDDTKYKVGDQVEIVNYGALLYNGLLEADDMMPELIGEKGIIVKANKTQDIDFYALEGPKKHAWYHNSQLKLILRPAYE